MEAVVAAAAPEENEASAAENAENARSPPLCVASEETVTTTESAETIATANDAETPPQTDNADAKRKETSKALLEYHPTHVSPEEMIQVYDQLNAPDATLIDTVLANLQGNGNDADVEIKADEPSKTSENHSQPRSTEDLLAILEDGDVPIVDKDKTRGQKSGVEIMDRATEKSLALKQLKEMPSSRRKTPKNLNKILDVKIPATTKRFVLKSKSSDVNVESYVIEKGTMDEPELVVKNDCKANENKAVDHISFIEQDWADEDVSEKSVEIDVGNLKIVNAQNGKSSAHKHNHSNSDDTLVGKRGSSRVIKKKIIWDPDNPATYKFASSAITKNQSDLNASIVESSPRENSVRSKTVKNLPTKPNKDSPELDKVEANEKHNLKRKKMSEVDKLLMDEGAVNMIYQLERSNNANVPDLVLKPNSKSMISISKEKRNLINKTKIIKDAVFSVTKTDDHNSDGKALRTRREYVKKTFKKPNMRNSLQSPSHSEISLTDAVADESRIIRRHSSSSFSSGGLSPRPQSPSEFSMNSSKNQEDGLSEKISPNKSVNNNDSGIIVTRPPNPNSYAALKSRALKRKYSDNNRRNRIIIDYYSSNLNKKPKRNHIYSQVSMEFDGNVANIVIKSKKTYGLLDATLFEELNSAFLVICQFEINIVSIVSNNEFFCNGLDLQCGIEGTEEERVKNLDILIAKYRDFVMNLLNYRGAIIVGIDGECCGIGVILLPLVDFVIASKRSVFSLSADFHRLLPPEGLSLFDEMCFMTSKVKQGFILGGQKFTPNNALENGLISRICETESFSADLNSYVKEISMNPMEIFKMNKFTMLESRFVGLIDILDDEFVRLAEYWNSPSGQETIKTIYANI